MKIVVISKTYLPFEYKKTLIEIKKLGSEILLVEPYYWENYKNEQNVDEIKVFKTETYFTNSHHLFFFKNIFLEEISKFNPDIIKIHEEPFNYVTYNCLKRLRGLNVPKVGVTWQNIYKSYPFPFSFFEKYSHKVLKAIQAGNTEAKEILLKRGYGGLIEVIPEIGVDENLFLKNPEMKYKMRDEIGINREKIVIGYAGRLVKEKGIYLLIESFKELLKSGLDIYLFFMGAGVEKENILSLISSYKLNDRFILVDWVKTNEVHKYLNLLDILVLPSYYEIKKPFSRGCKEQFGRVLIEAMACEVATVGSTTGGIPDVIGDAGLLFKEKSQKDLTEKLNLLITDRVLREELAIAGRKRVLEHFTHKQVAIKTFQFYQNVLN